MRDVKATAGEFSDLYVAGDANRFGRGGHTWKAEARGRNSLAHDRAGSERDVFGVLDDGEIERPAIVHHLAGGLCGGDGLAIVRHRDDTRFTHSCDVGDIFALAADTGGADGPDVDVTPNFGAIDNEAGDGSVVVDGLGVGH